MLRLTSGGAVLDLLPEIGGAVGRFTVDGIDVLRPAVPGAHSPLETACFPLVPFANRIANGIFRFGGRTITLPRNFGDHPHPLHGQGWQNPWQVLSATHDTAIFAYEHQSDSWPWAYRAEQRFVLSSRALRIELILANCCTDAMPASVGFHPYFHRTPGAMLRTDVAGVWLSDDDGIPTAPAARATFLDLAQGAPLRDAPFVDHNHFRWSRRAAIIQPDGCGFIELTASPALHHLHIFLPRHSDLFCVEPVSAMPDAFNRESARDDVHVIAPGAALSVWMEIAVRTSAQKCCIWE